MCIMDVYNHTSEQMISMESNNTYKLCSCKIFKQAIQLKLLEELNRNDVFNNPAEVRKALLKSFSAPIYNMDHAP